MSADIDLIAERVGRTVRTAPFERLAVKTEGQAFDDDDGLAFLYAESPRDVGVGRIHRQGFLGRRDDLAAACFIEWVQQVVEVFGGDVEQGGEAVFR